LKAQLDDLVSENSGLKAKTDELADEVAQLKSKSTKAQELARTCRMEAKAKEKDMQQRLQFLSMLYVVSHRPHLVEFSCGRVLLLTW
jgi:uncharacterized protein YlxW (UPF0749 family)